MADHDHLHMSLFSIRCFSDDGKLDASELRKILAIAERDGTVDEEEKRVLGNIIGKIRAFEVDAELAELIASVNSRLGTDFRVAG